MAQEKEIKIILKIPLQEFINRLKSRGYKNKGTSNQLDIYFDTPDWYYYNNIAAIRIRLVNNIEHSFSFKKVFYLPKKQDKYHIEEIETTFPIIQTKELEKIFFKIYKPISIKQKYDYKKLSSTLIELGFQDEQKMNKSRTKFVLDDQELTIDDVEQVGTIIEMECQKSDPNEKISLLLDKNEWERSVEGTSYIWLKNVKGFDSHIKNFKRFLTQPDWNVWENEKDFYSQISK